MVEEVPAALLFLTDGLVTRRHSKNGYQIRQRRVLACILNQLELETTDLVQRCLQFLAIDQVLTLRITFFLVVNVVYSIPGHTLIYVIRAS